MYIWTNQLSLLIRLYISFSYIHLLMTCLPCTLCIWRFVRPFENPLHIDIESEKKLSNRQSCCFFRWQWINNLIFRKKSGRFLRNYAIPLIEWDDIFKSCKKLLWNKHNNLPTYCRSRQSHKNCVVTKSRETKKLQYLCKHFHYSPSYWLKHLVNFQTNTRAHIYETKIASKYHCKTVALSPK